MSRRDAMGAVALVIAIAAFGRSAGAIAEERALTGPEIRALIEGNTVIGESVSGSYTQYFDPTGLTTYADEGAEPTEGRWRVEGDQYCSTWPPGEAWICYDVTADLAASPPTITWIGESGTQYPGVVHEGKLH